MKRILLALILIIIPLVSHAADLNKLNGIQDTSIGKINGLTWGTASGNATKVNGVSAAGGACSALTNCSGASTCPGSSGCLIRETFESCAANCASGCDVSWSVGGTGSAVCNASNPITMQGTKGYGATVTGTWDIRKTFTASDSVYMALIVYIDTCGSGYPGFISLDDGVGQRAFLDAQGGCTWKVKSSGGTAAGEYTIPEDTKVYVKVKGTKGTGANATAQWWTSTDGTTWTDRGTSNNGTWTGQLVAAQIFVRDETIYIDDVRVSTSDINY